MAVINAVVNKRPEKTIGELSDREIYLLKAMLNLLLYVGFTKQDFPLGSTSAPISGKVPVNMG